MARRLIIVDGYNLVGAWWGLDRLPLEQARDRLLRVLWAYGVARGHRLMVVFDGSLEVQGVPVGPLHKGVETYFTKGTTADDAIVRLVERAFGNCVLVTNDRDLRRRCERKGAVVVACDEFRVFVERAGRCRTTPSNDEENLARPEYTRGDAGESSSKDDGTLQWLRFLAEVEPLDTHQESTIHLASGLPDEEELLRRMLEVPDGVVKGRKKDSNDVTEALSRRRPRRHEKARRDAYLKDL